MAASHSIILSLEVTFTERVLILVVKVFKGRQGVVKVSYLYLSSPLLKERVETHVITRESIRVQHDGFFWVFPTVQAR